MKKPPSDLRDIAREVFSEGYADRARARARRHKSAWNWLLLPAVLGVLAALTSGIALLALTVHGWVHAGQGVRGASGVGPVLWSLGSFFAALLPAFMAGNALVRLIPAARRALDAEAGVNPPMTYHGAQANLGRLAVVWTPVALALAMAGALMPW
jgi:hypothetical protein